MTDDVPATDSRGPAAEVEDVAPFGKGKRGGFHVSSRGIPLNPPLLKA